MPVQLYRIQADAVDGQLRSITIFDEITAVNPITDEAEGTGKLLPPSVITPETDPELFALFNARGAKTTERVQQHRDKRAADNAAALAERTAQLDSEKG